MANMRMNIGLSKDLHAQLKEVSAQYGIPLSSIITFSIINFLDQRNAFAVAELYKRVEKENIINNKKLINK